MHREILTKKQKPRILYQVISNFKHTNRKRRSSAYKHFISSHRLSFQIQKHAHYCTISLQVNRKKIHTRAGARSEYSGRSWMHLQSLVKSLFLHCSRRCYSLPDWVSNYIFRSLTAARVPRPTFTLHDNAASVTAARLTAMIKPHNRVNRWWKTRFMKPIRQTVVLTSMTAAHSGCRAFKMGDTRLPRHPPTYMIAIADICPPYQTLTLNQVNQLRFQPKH